jgi:hypothetical protein
LGDQLLEGGKGGVVIAGPVDVVRVLGEVDVVTETTKLLFDLEHLIVRGDGGEGGIQSHQEGVPAR